MDVLIIPCPGCGHELRLPDLSLLGRFGRCPECQHKFVLEDPLDRLADTGEFVPSDDEDRLPDGDQRLGAADTVALAAGDSVPECENGQRDVPQMIGRYRIDNELGQGAMGAVYLAFDTQLERPVALKVPKFSEADGPAPVERFYREARLAATLSHPSICPVYDIGEADGTRYIAMAYINGRPLNAFIRRSRPQPLRHIAKTICRVALAVQEAHEHGVVHRDLKPDNVMIDENRRPVIMDFGLARKLFRKGDERLTHSGTLVGSPAYMSPEQVEGDPARITSSSDIYSLGVVLYELMTGLRPFRGYIGVVMGQILRDEPQPPSELRPDVDPQLESICLRMMAKRPEDRFASMDEVAHALAAYVRRSSQSSPASPMPTVELPVFDPQNLADLEEGADRDPAEQQGKASRSAQRSGNRATAGPGGRSRRSTDSVCRTARRLIDNHDYEHAVGLLRKIPEADRNEEIQRLLSRSLELRNQVKSLIADVNRARQARDYFDLDQTLNRLLELKPGHRQARRLLEKLAQKGYSPLAAEPAPDKKAAQWVLRVGGAIDVMVDGNLKQGIDSVRELPAKNFRLTSIGLFNRLAVTDAELEHLAGLSALETLTLTQTGVTDAGLRHLQDLAALTSLYLGFTGLTGSGLKHLGGLSRLVKLDLANTGVCDSGVSFLTSLGSLEFLGLFGTQVTDAGVEHLVRLRSLTFLDLYDSQVTDAGVKRLAEALPGCRINH